MITNRAYRIIIAGGGTGGHIFPAIAIAGALKAAVPGVELLFVGAKGKMEMEKVPQAGYNIEGIDIAGFNRSSLIKNIGLPIKLVRSFIQVSGILKRFRPDAVVGVGGYSSFPVLRAAQAKGIPTFIHESNSFAGKSNQLLGKKATKVFVASDGMEKFFPADKLMITGNPVRKSIVGSRPSRDAAIRVFGLDSSKPTILVTGGSLGAKGINEAIAAGLNEFVAAGVQVIWQTGKPFAETAAAAVLALRGGAGTESGSGISGVGPTATGTGVGSAVTGTGVGPAVAGSGVRPAVAGTVNAGIWTGAFITKMEEAFAAADVVVSRSGAMSIAELCVVGKPVVFVPFPFAAEDHQTVNAKHLVDKGAGLMVKDSEAREKLVSTAISLLKDEGLRSRLSAAIGGLAVTNADAVIAGEILKKLNG